MTFRSKGAEWDIATSGTTALLETPAGVVAGDRLIALWTIDQSTSTITTPTPSDWSRYALGQTLFDGQSYWGFERIATGSEGASVQFDITTGYNGGWGVMLAFSGRDTNPVRRSDFTDDGGGSASPISAASVATTGGGASFVANAGDDMLYFAALDQSSDVAWSFTNPSGLVTRSFVTAGTAGYASLAAATKDTLSAGAIGAITGTFTHSSDSAGWNAVVFLIGASASGGTSISPDPGSISISGDTPIVLNPVFASPGPGAVAITGRAPMPNLSHFDLVGTVGQFHPELRLKAWF